ncbi:hypothetical protein CH296_20085 [Rhodococcus sp. 14-2496-1d]|nr:hypothetical protein CH296_20085 [Rhodococcus sp. 14-2496-1d]
MHRAAYNHFMASVYLVDTLSYEASGGRAEPFATLKAAMASRSWVTEWVHERDADTGHETWTQAGRNSIEDIEEIRLVEIGP